MLSLVRGLCRALVGPRFFYRQRIKLPIISFIYNTVELYRVRTNSGIANAKEILFRGSVVASITSILVWLSIFMYVAFYYIYVPTITHERPVHLQFKSCDDKAGLCSFPAAHVQLTKRQQLLMLGQPYRIHLELEMPESPSNKELGMFMVCADFRGKDGFLITSSCRSTMLHYKSWLTELIYTVMYTPLFILAGTEEKQLIHVELFADYEEQENEGVTDVYVEIQTKYIQLYSAKFLINAHFSGLRYVMFYWPVLSAAIGITSNLFFIAIVCMISWYQLVHSEEYTEFVQSKKRANFPKDMMMMDDDSSSSFDEDPSSLQETEMQSELRKRILEERIEDVKPELY